MSPGVVDYRPEEAGRMSPGVADYRLEEAVCTSPGEADCRSEEAGCMSPGVVLHKRAERCTPEAMRMKDSWLPEGRRTDTVVEGSSSATAVTSCRTAGCRPSAGRNSRRRWRAPIRNCPTTTTTKMIRTTIRNP
jgi:hypothetical protein